MPDSCLTIDAIGDLFAEEVHRLDGRVLDTFKDERRLFTRSVLPLVDEVQPNDRVKGGVALKASAGEICIYPYVFREVCRNGAIMAHAIDSTRFALTSEDAPQESEFAVREAIRTCGRKNVFVDSVRDVSMTTSRSVDFALMMLPMLSSLGQRIPGSLLQQILDRFVGEEERSQFSLMNAITSVARDTADPEQRWRLEELGGAIAANILTPLPADESGVERLPQIEHQRSWGRKPVVA